jgi:hypothetical protein
MLSKCLNPHCSATFQYLGQGRLFRADFREAGRKNARTAKSTVAPIRRKTYPIEHFWLCEDCAKTMTVALSDGGEIRLIALEASAPGPATVPVPQPCGSYEATAS